MYFISFEDLVIFTNILNRITLGILSFAFGSSLLVYVMRSKINTFACPSLIGPLKCEIGVINTV